MFWVCLRCISFSDAFVNCTESEPESQRWLLIVLLYFDMDILFICIQSLTFFPADSKTVTNSWNTAAKMTAEFSDIVLLSVGCVFIGLFCLFVFLYLCLFYFSTLAVIGRLIEDKCRALLSQSLGSFFPSKMWLKTSTFRLVLVSVGLCAFLLSLSL